MVCINIEPLEGNEVAPPLKKDKAYSLIQAIVCQCGSKHYDVGIVSQLAYVRCFECKAPLPLGDEIHWCHPSRFVEDL